MQEEREENVLPENQYYTRKQNTSNAKVRKIFQNEN